MEFPQLPKISNDSGKAFTAPMCELLKKYADVITKPSKPVALDIKHKTELLDPEKLMHHHRMQIMSKNNFKKCEITYKNT